jgi:twitching motility protein PilU
MEILLASPLINDLILRGEIHQLKEIMAKSNRLGMQTFDQALFTLYEDGTIAYDDAMRNADSKNELRLRIKLESERDSSSDDAAAEKLAVVGEEN